MATDKQPKSILKKPAYPATTKTKADRDREVALYHANLILQILLSTETLIDYPFATSPFDATNPSPSDAQSFKDHIRQFRPSDYDDLITERNINDHCGYTLCPNPRLKEEGGGRYRLIYKTGRAKDFKVVEKSELEKWCSDACARRAMYVRVQLSESPAWERGAAGSGVNIDLLDEPKSAAVVALAGMEGLSITDGEVEQKGQADLALERGEQNGGARSGLVGVEIRENLVLQPAEAPSFEYADLSGRLDTLHLTLEGHTTSFGSQAQRRRNGESIDNEDENSMEWQS
jgi:hypothetical protein